MKSKDSEATTMLHSFRAPAPRKVSNIVRNNSKDWFGTSQAPVITTTIGLRKNSESDAFCDNSEENSGDCHHLSVTSSPLPVDEEFHELSYPSQGNAHVDLESFYPEVLNFESGEIVAANGSIHTIMRTTTCESGIVQSSVSVGKSKEPTVSVIWNCLNSTPEAWNPGSNMHYSRKAVDSEDSNPCVINWESTTHSYTAVMGDADSSGSPGLVKRTPPSPPHSPFKIHTLNAIDREDNSTRRFLRNNYEISLLHEVSESADPAQESLGVPAVNKDANKIQPCIPHPGQSFAKLFPKKMEEFNAAASGAEGDRQPHGEHPYQKQWKANKVNRQQKISYFPPSEELDRVHGTLNSVNSTERSSDDSCVSLRERSEGEVEEVKEGVEMKKSYDSNICSYDSMHLTASAYQTIPDIPLELPWCVTGFNGDVCPSTPSLDPNPTTSNIGHPRNEKCYSLHFGPQIHPHPHIHPYNRTNTSIMSPSNDHVTVKTLLTALARHNLSTPPRKPTNPIRIQQNFVPRAAAQSYLSVSLSPMTTTSTELMKQGTRASVFLFLAVTLLISVCTVFELNKTFPSYPSPASTSPWIGQYNASDVISDRYRILLFVLQHFARGRCIRYLIC